jgi:hypothetical protein
MEVFMKFSRLDKTQKTFEHINLIYEAICNNVKILSIGNLIQKRELEDHLKRLGCIEGEKHQKECLEWIEKNAKPLRIYLNSLIDFSEFLYFDSRLNYRGSELIKELVYDAIDIWNESLEILEQIRLEEKI